MKTPEHSLSSLEHVLQRAFQRVAPPPRFVRGLGRKIQVMPPRPIVGKANGMTFFLLVILVGALLMGTVGVLLARLLRRHSILPRT